MYVDWKPRNLRGGLTLKSQMIYLAIGCFAAGSLIAAIAGNFTVVIAGRVIQGLGGGSLITLTEVNFIQKSSLEEHTCQY